MDGMSLHMAQCFSIKNLFSTSDFQRRVAYLGEPPRITGIVLTPTTIFISVGNFANIASPRSPKVRNYSV
jgi:hypothetical protein